MYPECHRLLLENSGEMLLGALTGRWCCVTFMQFVFGDGDGQSFYLPVRWFPKTSIFVKFVQTDLFVL